MTTMPFTISMYVLKTKFIYIHTFFFLLSGNYSKHWQHLHLNEWTLASFHKLHWENDTQQKEICTCQCYMHLYLLWRKKKRKEKKTDRGTDECREPLSFSSGIVIIIVVRHAANNKQHETDDCVCVFYFLENVSSIKKQNNIDDRQVK